MRLVFHTNAWDDYLFWQVEDRSILQDRSILRKISELVRDIKRAPFTGLGKPEPLRFEFSGCWSRRIDQEHRLVYRVEGEDIHILACRYHY